MIFSELKKIIDGILHEYNLKRIDMTSAPQTQEHPNQEVNFKSHICGKASLQYDAVIKMGEAAGYTEQEMMDRIAVRGITNEFKIWKDACYANCLDRMIGHDRTRNYLGR